MQNNNTITTDKVFTDIIPRIKQVCKMIDEEFKDEPRYVDCNKFARLKPFQIEGICRILSPYMIK
jgi:hypothetical protein